MAPGSRGAGAVFARFPVKIPAKRGKLPANREFHVVAGVSIFPTHPGPHVNLFRVGRLCARRRLSGRKTRETFGSFFLAFCLRLCAFLT
jgi:hypothetical protein